jgi:hypothetical protein
MVGWEAGSGACPICSKRYVSMFGAEHYLRLPTLGLPTQLNGTPSPPPVLHVFWTKVRSRWQVQVRMDWKQSSLWHYWIKGCLANSSTRFRKFFRITHSLFDEIYLAATDRLNPTEPLFARAFPEIPPGKHGAQLPKVCPLCLRIGACLRRLVTDDEAHRESRRARAQDVDACYGGFLRTRGR